MWSRLPSTLVTSSAGPTGRQPCDTTTSTLRFPDRAIAKPPPRLDQSFRISRFELGVGPALAIPPTTRTPGAP